MLVAVFAFFIGNGQTPQILGQARAALRARALRRVGAARVANASGATRAWFLALLIGFTSAVLAALIATTVTAAASGIPVSGACSSSCSARS